MTDEAELSERPWNGPGKLNSNKLPALAKVQSTAAQRISKRPALYLKRYCYFLRKNEKIFQRKAQSASCRSSCSFSYSFQKILASRRRPLFFIVITSLCCGRIPYASRSMVSHLLAHKSNSDSAIQLWLWQEQETQN